MDIFDVIIVGAGPAGLNAAVVLGRCNRKVLLFDHGKQRNRHAQGMHNYLTRDDISPKKFLKLSLEEIKKYGVKFLRLEIHSAKKEKDNLFAVRDVKGKMYQSRKMLLATGLADILPEVTGTTRFYGTSIHHCPYCDGWEHNNEKIGVYSKDKSGVELAQTLQRWSDDITLFTDGENFMTASLKKILKKKNIALVEEDINAFKGRGSVMKYVELKNGDKIGCDTIFFCTGYCVQSHLVDSLGCNTGENHIALTDDSQKTNVEGLYVAGDTTKDIHFVVVAAAEGAKAAVYINKELVEEDT
ncbi:NAD(P)/FAD-dependent oxidoreductase [soil metagenome]